MNNDTPMEIVRLTSTRTVVFPPRHSHCEVKYITHVQKGNSMFLVAFPNFENLGSYLNLRLNELF